MTSAADARRGRAMTAAKGAPGTTDTFKKGGPWDPEARSAAYRRTTVEVETVYPTDLLVRWIVRRWRSWRSQ